MSVTCTTRSTARRAPFVLLAAFLLIPAAAWSKRDEDDPPPPMPEARDVAVAKELNDLLVQGDTNEATTLLRKQIENKADSDWEPETWLAFWRACSLPIAATDFLSGFVAQCADNDAACAVVVEIARLLRAQGRFDEARGVLSPRPGANAAWSEELSAQAGETGQAKLALTLHELPVFEDHETVLNRIRRRFAMGNREEAAAELRNAVTEAEDKLVVGLDGKLVEARSFVFAQLADWPPELRDPVLVDERREAARALSETAAASVERGALWRRHRHPPSMQALLRRQAEEYLEQGRFGLAASRFSLLAQVRLDPSLAVRYAFALVQSDGPEAADRFVRSLPDDVSGAPVTVGAKRTTLRDAVGGWVASGRPGIAESAGPDGELPYTIELTVRAPLRFKRTSLRMRPVSPPTFYTYPTTVPVESGDRVYLNVGNWLCAVDIPSARLAWTYHARPTRLYVSWEERDARPFPVDRLGVLRGLGNTLFVRMTAANRKETAYSLRLALMAIDAESGRRRWTTQLGDVGSHHIFSEPTLYRETLYMLTALPDSDQTTCFATAIDAENGDILWSRPLVKGIIRYGAPVNGFEPPAPVGTPAGVVFSTPLGCLACLDPLTGSIQWITQYPRVSFLDAAPACPAVAPQTGGGVLVCTPRDSQQTLALDVNTGDIKWAHPRLWSEVVATCTDERVLLAGQKAVELDINTGEALREVALGGPFTQQVITRVGSDLWISGNGTTSIVASGDLAVRPPQMVEVASADHAFALGRFVAAQHGPEWRFVTADAGAFSPDVAACLETRALLRERRGSDGAAIAQRASDVSDPRHKSELQVAGALVALRAGSDAAARTAAARIAAPPTTVGPVPVPWGTIRPGHFADVLAGRPDLPGTVSAPSAPTRKARPRLLWQCPDAGMAVPEDRRGGVLKWDGEAITLAHLSGFAEPLWKTKLPPLPLASKQPREQEPSEVTGVLWCGDSVVVHNPFYLLALRIDTGEPVWRCDSRTHEFRRSRLVAVRGRRVLFTENRRTALRCIDLGTGKDIRTERMAEGVSIGAIWRDADRSFIYARGDDGTWQVRALDEGGRLGEAIREGPKQTWPMLLADDKLYVHRRETMADFLSAEKLGTGEATWSTKFGEPIGSVIENLRPPGSERSWLRLQPFEAPAGSIVLDAATGEILIRSKKEKIRVIDGMFFVVRSGRKGEEFGRVEADILQFVDGGIGLDDTDDVPAVPEDFSLKWDFAEKGWQPYPKSVVGLDGVVLVVAHLDRWIHLFGFDAETGKPALRAPLIPLNTPGSVLDISWHQQGRYLLVAADGRRYCFEMADNANRLDGWARDRLRTADATLAPEERPTAREAIYLAESRPGRGGIDLWKPQEQELALDAPGMWRGREDGAGTPVGRWSGAGDSSATVDLRIARDAVTVSVVVKDNVFVPFTGVDNGDHVVVRMRRPLGTHNLRVGLNPNGFPELLTQPEDKILLRKARASVTFSEGTVRYEIRVRDSLERTLDSSWSNQHNAYIGSIAIELVDDDGDGVKGALVWPSALPLGAIQFSRLVQAP